MPNITFEGLNKIFPRGKGPVDYPIFIQTGTCRGDTAAQMATSFGQIVTIEIEPILYRKAKERFENTDNVSVIHGDSSVILPAILPQLNKPALFFLDAHYSGGDTGHGVQKVPLLSELKTITNRCRFACIIVVDNARLFGLKNDGAGCDWTSITAQSVLSIVKPRLIHYFTFPSSLADVDQLVLHLAPLKPVAATATGNA